MMYKVYHIFVPVDGMVSIDDDDVYAYHTQEDWYNRKTFYRPVCDNLSRLKTICEQVTEFLVTD